MHTLLDWNSSIRLISCSTACQLHYCSTAGAHGSCITNVDSVLQEPHWRPARGQGVPLLPPPMLPRAAFAWYD
jgi:hypothetical protein